MYLLLLWLGKAEVHAQIGLPPVIIVQPSDQSVPEGGTATFSVTATSLTALKYQWRRNGVNITNATSRVYTRYDVHPADVGTYTVRVSNSAGAVTSAGAELTISTADNQDDNTPLKFVGARMQSNGFQCQLVGPTSGIYVILVSSNLSDWTTLYTNQVANGSMQYTDPQGTNAGPRYYLGMVRRPPGILEENLFGGSKVDIRMDQKGAQSFRHGTAGGPAYRINKVVIYLSRDSQAPNASLIFSIGSSANSAVIAGSTRIIQPSEITNTSGGNSFQTYEIIYSTSIGLAAGTTYYLNLECEASNGRKIHVESAGGDAYANGTFYESGVDKEEDIRFQIWGN